MRGNLSCGRGEAKALLEGSEILVRGAFRWRVLLTELQSVEVSEGKLKLAAASGVCSLKLGEKTAAKWAEKIRNPPSLMKRLGVKQGCRYVILGEAASGFTEQLEIAGAINSPRNPDMVFAFAESDADLAKAWELASIVWVMYLKGRKDFTEAQVRDHGRALGMMDTKVASFSSVLTALRFSRMVRAV